MNNHERGRSYEYLAAAFLADRGWTVVGRNVRFRRKELDLVVRRGRTVAFVEVKGRRGARFGDPLDAITARKRRGIESVARWWIEQAGRPNDHYEFHAVAVYDRGCRGCVVRHVSNAW